MVVGIVYADDDVGRDRSYMSSPSQEFVVSVLDFIEVGQAHLIDGDLN